WSKQRSVLRDVIMRFVLALFTLTGLAFAGEHSFDATREIEGKTYILVGTGSPKKASKGYVMGLYVEEADGKRAFPALATRVGHDHGKLVNAEMTPSFIVWGHFCKTGVLHFVQPTEGDEVESTFRDSLKDEISEKAAPDVKKAAQAFLAV